MLILVRYPYYFCRILNCYVTFYPKRTGTVWPAGMKFVAGSRQWAVSSFVFHTSLFDETINDNRSPRPIRHVGKKRKSNIHIIKANVKYTICNIINQTSFYLAEVYFFEVSIKCLDLWCIFHALWCISACTKIWLFNIFALYWMWIMLIWW